MADNFDFGLDEIDFSGVDYGAAERSLDVGPTEEPSMLESGLRGAAQGATLNFADELEGAAKAAGFSSPLDFAIALVGPEKFADRYRRYRDDARKKYEAAERANPKMYLGGQVVGGLATAALPGGAPATALKALGSGVLYGAGSGMGASKADLTRGEFVDAAVDTAGGGLVGGVAGVGGYGAVKAAGASLNALRSGAAGARAATTVLDAGGQIPQAVTAARVAARDEGDRVILRRLAGDVAATADTATVPGTRETVRSFTEETQRMLPDIQARARRGAVAAGQELGDDLELRPSQLTGDRRLALSEQYKAQTAETTNAASAAEIQQKRAATFALEDIVNEVADDSSRLGRADVAKDIAAAIEGYIADLRKARSEAGGPWFRRFYAATGKARFTGPKTQETARRLIRELGEGSSAAEARPLRKTLEALEDGASLETMASERSAYAAAQEGYGTVFEKLDDSRALEFARQMREAIEADLDDIAGSVGPESEAVGYLRKANELWAEYSKPINEAGTNTAKALLKVGNSDGFDTLMGELESASIEQVKGIFRILNKKDPRIARQARAQMLEDQLVRAGKNVRGAALNREAGIEPISYDKLWTQFIGKSGEQAKLLAAYEGDEVAQQALRTTFQLVRRLSVKANLKNSQTLFMAEEAAKVGAEVAEKAVDAAGGKLAGRAFRELRGVLSSPKTFVDATSNPRAIQEFNRALHVLLSERSGAKISEKTIRGIVAGLTQAGVAFIDEETE